MMVERIFSIRGENIFDVGLRFSLIELAGEYNVKVQPVNLRHENRVQVVASGSVQDIESLYYYISKNDVRYLKHPKSPYSLSEMKDYNDSKIDFEHYKQSFMTGQLGKILYNAIPMQKNLKSVDSKLDAVIENTDDMKNDVNEMKDGIREMVSTLKNIDKNTSKA
jgi:acylphosphatase